jgi:hypothetical protein
MNTINPNNNEANPLSSFFRKKKLSLFLPSKGQWYPENSLKLDEDGSLPVFAMTATSDIKFRAGDINLSGKSTYELIKECVPGILQPELIPNIDIDSILLAIRLASYGDDFDISISVPNTKLSRTITVSLIELLKEIINRKDKWEDSVIIEDENGQQVSLTIAPIPLKYLFLTSKNIINQKKILTKNIDNDDTVKDEKVFENSVNQLSNTIIDLICSCIKSLELTDINKNIVASFTDKDSVQINKIIREMDIEYFNAIRDHLEAQRKKYTFLTPNQISTQKEISAGAPTEWTSEITFMGSSFLPENNAKQTII